MAAPVHNGSRLSFTLAPANDGTLVGVQTGELILVNVRWYSTGTITDLTVGGNAMTLLGSPQTGGPDNSRSQWATYQWGGSSGDQTVSCTISSGSGGVEAWRISGHNTSDPVGSRNGASGSGTTVSVDLTSCPAECIGFAIGTNNGGDFSSPGDSWSLLTVSDVFDFDSGMQKADLGATGTKTVSATISSGTWVINAIAIAPEITYTLEQEGFRFGNDDGNEASYTFAANQDTNHTAGLNSNLLLRMLVNSTTGDPDALAFTLRSQKNGAGGYVAVPLTTTSDVAPTIEAGDCTNSGNNTATSSWAISYPDAATGDLLVFCVAWDDSTNVTGLTAPNGPNGETPTTVQAVHADSGTTVRLAVFRYIATSAWTASTLTFTPSASEQWTATVIKVLAGEFDSTTPIGASATSVTDSAGTTHTLASFSAGSTDGGGRLCAWFSIDTVPMTSAPNGWTMPANVDRGAVGGTLATRDTATSDSESITGAAFTSASDTAAHVSFIIRGVTVTNEVYVSASSNIASGGEATTARLAAPSGKTTSDFVTGRRWDDENGTDTIDITTDDYTEVEWCLKAQSPAAGGDYYDFRVYAGSTALSSYAVTPRWTIGASDVTVEPSGSAITSGIGTKVPVFEIGL